MSFLLHMQATMHTLKKYHGLQGEEGQRSQAAGVCEGPGVRIRLQRWPGEDRIRQPNLVRWRQVWRGHEGRKRIRQVKKGHCKNTL